MYIIQIRYYFIEKKFVSEKKEVILLLKFQKGIKFCRRKSFSKFSRFSSKTSRKYER